MTDAVATEFAGLLREYRERAGHASGRSFYNAMGGRPFFGCTYKQYSNVESGRSLPKPLLVERIAAGLRLSGDEVQLRKYALAYLDALAGSPDLAQFLAAALLGSALPAGAAKPPFRQALQRSYAQRSVPLTRVQSELMLKDKVHYWTFTLLANDRARRTAADIARRLDFPEVQVRAALAAFVKAKLLARDGAGHFYCPEAGKVLLHPRESLYAPQVLETLSKHWGAMASKNGKLLLRQHLFTRASESAIRQYFPYLVQAVQGADIYSTHDHGPDTALVLVETVVRRVLPF